MNEHVETVNLEPTELQKLRLQLAERDCQLNIAIRRHLEAELRIHQTVLTIASATVPLIETQLADIEREGKELTQRLFEVAEQIKTENGWTADVEWDALTLTYSAPADNGWTAVPQQDGDSKIGIQ